MPRHINPVEPERTATAPYNFVPLPNKILTVDEGVDVNGKKEKLWDMHDQYVPGTHSGWIDLNLKTLTPLFIRGPITKIGEEWDKRDSRLRAEPFKNKDGVPVIPGSSLRGMIRSLVEVLSFSKINPVTDERPFFRTVSDDRIGKVYRKRMIHAGQKPNGGFARNSGNQWVILPAKEVLKVRHELLTCCGIPDSEHPNQDYHPSWYCQHKPCWFQRSAENSKNVDRFSLTKNDVWEEGVLVLTGFVGGKKHEFIFVAEDNPIQIEIPEDIFRRFHEKEQITKWQKEAFPANSPPNIGRIGAGVLRDGEPLFFLSSDSEISRDNPGGVVFFGRAQMFRYPYDCSPLDLVPEKIRNAGLDLAEILFGTIEREIIKSRVYFNDALAQGESTKWFEEIIVPRILASPKITCFQHYLTQDGTKEKDELTTYLKSDKTTIRGHKYYWHNWDIERKNEAVKEVSGHNNLLLNLQLPNPVDKQHTIIRPVKKDVNFTARINFNNLSDIELGALLTALELPDGCAHKIGMCKPLGLGSIQIKTKLFLISPHNRYASWGKDGFVQTDEKDFIHAFEEYILEHARNSEETIIESNQGLLIIKRLQALNNLLNWDAKPAVKDIEYMPVDEFRQRKVLLTPHKVIGQDEPLWRDDPPKPGLEKENKMNMTVQELDITNVVTPMIKKKPIGSGQTLDGTLMKKGEHWVALFDGDSREAIIVNSDKITDDVIDGSKAIFYIKKQSKKDGIVARIDKLL